MRSTYTRGIGRYVSSVMTYDDTIFLMAGAKANSTASLNTVWTSYAADADSTAPSDLSSLMSISSGATGILTNAGVSLYFTEAVTFKKGGEVTIAKGAANLAATTTLSRQVLTIQPKQPLTANTDITVTIQPKQPLTA